MTPDQFTFTDDAASIADNPAGIARQAAAGRAYDAYGQELAEDARAILHSLSRRLSGYEITHCQAAAGLREDVTAVDASVIERLRNEFPREIAAAKQILDRK